MKNHLDNSQIAHRAAAAFRGEFLSTVSIIEEELKDLLTLIYFDSGDSKRRLSFRRILLEHRDITFATRIELLEQTAKIISAIPSVTGVVKRLNRVRKHRNQLAHAMAASVGWADDPEQVTITLDRWRKDKQDQFTLKHEDQLQWLEEAVALRFEVGKISLTLRQFRESKTELRER